MFGFEGTRLCLLLTDNGQAGFMDDQPGYRKLKLKKKKRHVQNNQHCTKTKQLVKQS